MINHSHHIIKRQMRDGLITTITRHIKYLKITNRTGRRSSPLRKINTHTTRNQQDILIFASSIITISTSITTINNCISGVVHNMVSSSLTIKFIHTSTPIKKIIITSCGIVRFSTPQNIIATITH